MERDGVRVSVSLRSSLEYRASWRDENRQTQSVKCNIVKRPFTDMIYCGEEHIEVSRCTHTKCKSFLLNNILKASDAISFLWSTKRQRLQPLLALSFSHIEFLSIFFSIICTDFWIETIAKHQNNHSLPQIYSSQNVFAVILWSVKMVNEENWAWKIIAKRKNNKN